MKQEILVKKLRQKMPVFIYDDYEEAVIRITPLENQHDAKIFIKYKNCSEVETTSTNETVCDIILRGVSINEEEYYNY
jgi:hypothetical protein